MTSPVPSPGTGGRGGDSLRRRAALPVAGCAEACPKPVSQKGSGAFPDRHRVFHTCEARRTSAAPDQSDDATNGRWCRADCLRGRRVVGSPNHGVTSSTTAHVPPVHRASRPGSPIRGHAVTRTYGETVSRGGAPATRSWLCPRSNPRCYLRADHDADGAGWPGRLAFGPCHDRLMGASSVPCSRWSRPSSSCRVC